MDEIVGISVLQPAWIPGIYRLWFRGRKADGSIAQGSIFIKDAAAVGLPTQMPDEPEGCNTIWNFNRSGERLDCFPSVNWISWGFHNGYNWSTEFVEMAVAERKWVPDAPETARQERGSAIHYDLNNINAADEQRRIWIAELRSEGILK